MDPWAYWVIAAAVLIIAEIFTAGFFIIGFGLGALPAALVAYMFPKNIALQLGVFIVGSAIFLFFARKFAAFMYARGSQENVGAQRMIGKCCMVLETIDPVHGKGKVRLEHDQWRAETTDGSVIESGTQVEVVRIDGTRLIVQVPNQG